MIIMKQRGNEKQYKKVKKIKKISGYHANAGIHLKNHAITTDFVTQGTTEVSPSVSIALLPR